jgi:hypothetical protein
MLPKHWVSVPNQLSKGRAGDMQSDRSTYDTDLRVLAYNKLWLAFELAGSSGSELFACKQLKGPELSQKRTFLEKDGVLASC